MGAVRRDCTKRNLPDNADIHMERTIHFQVYREGECGWLFQSKLPRVNRIDVENPFMNLPYPALASLCG